MKSDARLPATTHPAAERRAREDCRAKPKPGVRNAVLARIRATPSAGGPASRGWPKPDRHFRPVLRLPAGCIMRHFLRFAPRSARSRTLSPRFSPSLTRLQSGLLFALRCSTFLLPLLRAAISRACARQICAPPHHATRPSLAMTPPLAQPRPDAFMRRNASPRLEFLKILSGYRPFGLLRVSIPVILKWKGALPWNFPFSGSSFLCFPSCCR